MKRETIVPIRVAFTLASLLALTGPAGAGKPGTQPPVSTGAGQSPGAQTPTASGTGQSPAIPTPLPAGNGQSPAIPTPYPVAQGGGSPFPQAVVWPEDGEVSPIQELENSGESPVDVLLDGIYELDPRDIELVGTQRQPELLWRGQPVLFADLRDLLYDDEIDMLLEILDNEPDLWEPAADLTDFLHRTRFLPRQFDVVGVDLLDQPPVFFVLPF